MTRRVPWLRLLVAIVAVVAAAVAAAELASQSSGPGMARRTVDSIFEDDQLLVYQPLTRAGSAEVQRTLLTIKALGADRIRVALVWSDVAPDNAATTAPSAFDAADPAAYPLQGWLAYDRVVRLARLDGLSVLLTLTAPGPLWANAPRAPDAKTATHYLPDATAFGRFVEATGRRFSGSFTPPGEPGGPLPRVSEWSIWNEPNQPGWLAPQSAGAEPVAPRLYRGLVDAAYAGLVRSGHGPTRDTILIGELAPDGSDRPGPLQPLTPMVFLRALYCVDTAYRPLRGAAAAALGCPPSDGAPGAFAQAHPGLFRATGFAHHPYSLLTAPDVRLANPDEVPLSELPRLEHGLDRIFAAYGVDRRLPLYLTEYGYITDPPNICGRGVPLATQSRYLDEAEYLAWRDRRVRAFAQFDLQDQSHPAACPWITFQSGLEFLGGAPKPSFAAYRLPIFLPSTTTAPGGSLLVWGMLRPAPNGTRQRAQVQWRPAGGAYRTIATVTTANPSGFLTARVTPPATGTIRLSWDGIASREVAVSVGG